MSSHHDMSDEEEPGKRKNRLKTIICNIICPLCICKKCCGKVSNKFTGVFDSYGGGVMDSPSFRKPTMCGACLSLLFKALFIGLLVVAMFKLWDADKVIAEGNPMILNPRSDKDPPKNDFPPLAINVHHQVNFFERKYTSLQRISVKDVSGIPSKDKILYTSDERDEIEDPKVQAVHKTLKVPLGSFLDSAGEVYSSTPSAGLIVFSEAVSERATHRYLSETMKGIKSTKGGYFKNVLSNHTFAAYVRLQNQQLTKLKSCQLQILIFNEREWNLIEDNAPGGMKNRSNHRRLTSLTFPNDTWRTEFFSDNDGTHEGNYQTVAIEREYTFEDIITFSNMNDDLDMEFDFEDSDFMFWSFAIIYVPNFASIVDTGILCTSSPEWFEKGFGRGLNNLTNTQMWLPAQTDPKPNFCETDFFENNLPFSVLLQSHAGKEIVEVTSVEGDCSKGMVFTIERETGPDRVNFTKVPGNSIFNYNFYPPDDWKCNPRDYWADDGICDCDCDAFDPDCWMTGRVSDKCEDGEVCSYLGKCVIWEAGELSETSKTIIISDACEQMYRPGQKYYQGFIGDESHLESCQICPYEKLYDYEPQYKLSTSSYVCTYHAEGKVDPRFQDITSMFDSGYYQFNISLFGSAPFPVCPIEWESCPETNVLFDGEQTSLVSSKKQSGTTQQMFLLPEQDSTDLLSRIGVGELFGSVTSKSKDVIVYPSRVGTSQTLLKFPETGFPYSVTTDRGENYIVTEATSTFCPREGKTFQVLTVEDYPQSTMGFRVVETTTVSKGTSRFNISFSAETDEISVADLVFPVFGFIEDLGDFQNSELVKIDQIISHNGWTCDLNQYNNPEDSTCSCGCGEYDPDCAKPSPAEFEGWVDGCDWDEYCEYPTGVCTATAPVSTSPPPPSSLVFEIVLGFPTKEDHENNFIIHGKPSESVSLRRLVPVTLQRTSQQVEYAPPNRAQKTSTEYFESPSQIEAEVSLFRVPHSPALDQLEDLSLEDVFCPDKPVTLAKNSWKTLYKDNWEIAKKRGIEPRCNSQRSQNFGEEEQVCLYPYTVSEMEDSEIGYDCALEMPITRTLEFDVDVPINLRFSKMLGTDGKDLTDLSVQDAEPFFQFDITYSFTYDSDVESVESSFSEEKKSSGDTVVGIINYGGHSITTGLPDSEGLDGLEEPSPRTYFGSLIYRDLGNGTSEDLQVETPASIPYLFFDARLKLDRRIQDLMKDVYWAHWPSRQSKIDEILELKDLDPLPIQWDIPGSTTAKQLHKLPLIPGTLYTLKAKIQLVPSYRDNYPASMVSKLPVLEQIFAAVGVYDDYIYSYRFVVMSTSYSSGATEKMDSSKCILKYQFELDGKINSKHEIREYVLSNLFSDVGSALALMGMGMVFLKLWQKCCHKKVSYDIPDKFAKNLLAEGEQGKMKDEKKKFKKKKRKKSMATIVVVDDGEEEEEEEEEEEGKQSLRNRKSRSDGGTEEFEFDDESASSGGSDSYEKKNEFSIREVKQRK